MVLFECVLLEFRAKILILCLELLIFVKKVLHLHRIKSIMLGLEI